MGSSKVKGRYQQKQDRGLVPHIYDKSSKRFESGAHKWPRSDRMIKADAHLLATRPTNYHQFVSA